jgi:hypothetical protein
MSPVIVIEVRTYRAKPGKRTGLPAILREQAFPVQRRLGVLWDAWPDAAS